MSLPSGEKRGKDSSPRGEESRTARPPVLGATHTSPAYTKAIWVADTAGWRSMRASSWAGSGDGVAAATAAAPARVGSTRNGRIGRTSAEPTGNGDDGRTERVCASGGWVSTGAVCAFGEAGAYAASRRRAEA